MQNWRKYNLNFNFYAFITKIYLDFGRFFCMVHRKYVVSQLTKQRETYG